MKKLLLVCIACLVWINAQAQLKFIGPSAVTYSKLNGKYYVVNNAGKDVVEMDKSAQGKVFITGLTAPDNILFANLPIGSGFLVLDSTAVKLYDTSGAYLGAESPSGAMRLQDLVFDAQAEILYVSDVLRGVIYKTTFGPAPFYLPSTIIFASGLRKPASLYIDKPNNRLVYTELDTASLFKTINLSTAAVGTLKATGLDYVIGLDRDAQGNWYFGSQGQQGVYTWNKYLSGSPKKVYFEPKPMDNIIIPQNDEWCYMCYSCGKVYIANLHIVGPWFEDMKCQGDSFVTYSHPSYKSIGTYSPGNKFIAEMSNINGIFTKDVRVLASVTDTLVPATMHGKLPDSLAAGTYRLRWRSTMPAGTSRFDLFMIMPKPNVKAAVEDSVEVCVGNSLVLGVGNSAAHHYQWSPASLANNDTFASPTFVLTNNMWISVECTDWTNGCKTKDSVFASIVLKPSLTLPDTIRACSGSIIKLGKENSDLKFKWSPSNLVSNDSISNPVFLGTSSAMLSCTVTAAGGCSSLLNQYGQYVENPLLESVPANFAYFCSNNNDSIIPQLSVSGKSYSSALHQVEWITPKNDTLAFPINSISKMDTGVHYFSVKDKLSGCLSDKKSLNVKWFKDITISLNYTSALLLGISDPNKVAQIQWFRNNVLLIDTGKQILTPDSGTYYAKITTKDGCIFTSEKLYIAKLIKNAKKLVSQKIVLENIQDELHLIIPGNLAIKQIMLLQANGSVYSTFKTNKHKINLNSILNPGLNIVMVELESGEKQSFKILKF